ncbi:MAG TPA: hypothetical protein PKL57_15690 [Candidatus Wallbacteria bacterium]|nr:hypothetical protein [Candidatus Wallbacteria bacterium]
MEILIATAIFAFAFMPVASVIFSTSKKTHQMDFELTAESIAKNILEQVLNNVEFDNVDITKLTVGVQATGSLINLDIAGATISGNTSGGIITVNNVDYKFEFEIKDIKADDMDMSFVQFKNTPPAWLSNQKVTGNDGIAKMDHSMKNKKATTFVGGNAGLVLMKTIKLRMSWRDKGEVIFNDKKRRFVLLTRKAKLSGALQ